MLTETERNRAFEVDKTVNKDRESSKKAQTTGKLQGTAKTKKTGAYRNGTQLFGLPYGFLPSTDQRFATISQDLGRSYIEHIALQAPVLYMIPGKPKYLPGSKNKLGITDAFIQAMSGNFSNIQEAIAAEEDIRLYDFQASYLSYFADANELCRTAAGFLDLTTLGDDETKFCVNGEAVNFVQFDWKNYRWDGTKYNAIKDSVTVAAAKKTTGMFTGVVKEVGKAVKGAVKTVTKTLISAYDFITGAPEPNTNDSTVITSDPSTNMDPEQLQETEDSLQRLNYLRFYIDPEGTQYSKRVSNSTQQSMFKQALDGMSGTVKDISFLVNAGGMDTAGLEKLGTGAMDAIDTLVGGTAASINNDAGTLIQRILGCGKTVIRGENIMMPDIWGSTDMSESHTFTCHYKAPYGNKLCCFVECLVPALHWVAAAYPKLTTGNSYASPYMIKAWVPGAWTVNLGIITSLEISAPESATNVDGLYNELDVTVEITSLYADLAISPPNDIALFKNNSALIEFLATSCGLSLIEAHLGEKIEMLVNQFTNNIRDIPTNVVGGIMERLDNLVMEVVGL